MSKPCAKLIPRQIAFKGLDAAVFDIRISH
jgi:hypothetical protein